MFHLICFSCLFSLFLLLLSIHFRSYHSVFSAADACPLVATSRVPPVRSRLMRSRRMSGDLDCMSIDRTCLDQVDKSDNFDLKYIYESQSDSLEDDENENTSKLINFPTCQYYSPSDLTELPGYKDYETNNSLSIFSLNCRSLTAHWEDLKHLLADITNESFHLDVIGLSEIFKIHSDFKLEGYHSFIYKNRPDQDDNRGGVGFFLSETNLITRLETTYRSSFHTSLKLSS